MKTLSKVQQGVLDKMQNGWELGCSHAFGRRCWLQRGKIGEGGESVDVRYETLSVLFDRGLIKQKGRVHGIMAFELAFKGLKNK